MSGILFNGVLKGLFIMKKCNFCIKSSSKGKCEADCYKEFYCNQAIEKMTIALQQRKSISLGKGKTYRNM